MSQRVSDVINPSADISLFDTILDETDSENNGKLGLIQKVKLIIFKKVKVSKRHIEGGNLVLPIYAFNCPEHGLQFNYPSGWRKVLKCTECFST